MNTNDINGILTKRFQTTMIGALFEFEETFGYLWGQNKDDNELTPSELKYRTIWEESRNAILNNGNNQLRKCVSDIGKIINPVKYTYKFSNKRGNYEN